MLPRKPCGRAAKTKAPRTANAARDSFSNVGAASPSSPLAPPVLPVLPVLPPIPLYLEEPASPPALPLRVLSGSLALPALPALLVPPVRPAFLNVVNLYLRYDSSPPSSLVLVKDTPYS
jgi:hypothetical protein